MYMPSARQWGKYCSVGRTELHWGTVGRAWPQASPGTAHGWPGRDKVQEPGRVGTPRLGSRAWGCWVAADLGSSKQPNSGNTAELGAIGDPHHRASGPGSALCPPAHWAGPLGIRQSVTSGPPPERPSMEGGCAPAGRDGQRGGGQGEGRVREGMGPSGRAKGTSPHGRQEGEDMGWGS